MNGGEPAQFHSTARRGCSKPDRISCVVVLALKMRGLGVHPPPLENGLGRLGSEKIEPPQPFRSPIALAVGRATPRRRPHRIDAAKRSVASDGIYVAIGRCRHNANANKLSRVRTRESPTARANERRASSSWRIQNTVFRRSATTQSSPQK